MSICPNPFLSGLECLIEYKSFDANSFEQRKFPQIPEKRTQAVTKIRGLDTPKTPLKFRLGSQSPTKI